MEIKLKLGVDKLVFGMKKTDVEKLYGKPDAHFEDEDGNEITVYNNLKFRLTYYVDEELRLGYISTSNASLTLHAQKLIGEPVEAVKVALMPKGMKSWEKDHYDITHQYFNEANWFWMQSEFGLITKIEFGVGMKEREDEFDWKFKP